MAAPTTPNPDPATDNPPRPRRWVPRSLRIFAALVLILGVASAWLGARGYRQLIAIREIERLEGNVESVPKGPNWLRDFVGDEKMRMFDEVDSVSLFHGQATDAAMRQIGKLTSLKRVWLNNTLETDAGLAHLTALAGLEELCLSGTPVTDIGLAHLKGLTYLQKLELDNTHTTDAGLKELKGLSNLGSLWLGNTDVTDAGLMHLKGLTSLKLLWLDNTHVTYAGVSDLQGALPGVVVYYNRGLH